MRFNILEILKRQSKLMIGFMIGIIVMGGISYGVNKIQSSSVSYTKSDGTTVSVKQALDDVINKSLTRIEFLEKWLSYNTGLGIEQIKNKTEFDYYYLSDVVAVGDYVAYDAGSWTETVAIPTSSGQFGGYTKDQNKANSAGCRGSISLKGWRVFSINTSTKTVTLIHAGHPECYYLLDGYSSSQSVTNLNNRATSTYLNRDYADSAHMMNKGEYDQNILRSIMSWYFLATDSSTTNLYRVYNNGGISDDYVNFGSFGIRPIVVLKPNILTTGKGFDKVGQSAWTLVKP